MATSMVSLCHMYEGLKYNFLFHNDIDSIHILLNLYDLEENITNICPKYICTKEIKKRIKSLLRYRDDRDLVASKIIYLILEDIDRLELYFYLEGYKYGYFNNKWVNVLEEKTLNYYTIEEMYEKKYLFHFDTENKIIRDLKYRFEFELISKEEQNKYIDNVIVLFCEKIIMNKIKNLNKYLDIQLKMDFDFSFIREEQAFFDEDSLNKLYEILTKYLYKNMFKTYKDSSWLGLNDKVLKRYS
ncbi:hypothetical protein [Anaerosalibacter sp. Marseille-P3206]|uniref:hypothetical protein n=1 Tax=Anaerosalibacter sp. Marseille-P3206 TaxID=1871005 RepID=UPI000987B860|nr:hypothetical protein [Anaerosalibacter sp. Marseille-P3206]